MVRVRVKGFRVFRVRVLGSGFFPVVFAGQILQSCALPRGQKSSAPTDDYGFGREDRA